MAQITKINNHLKEKLSLKDKYPQYINVWVFRFFILLIFLLLIFVVSVDGIKTTPQLYYSCPDGLRCLNPFYVCGSAYYEELSVGIQIDEEQCQQYVPDHICKQIPCHIKYFDGPVEYGKKAHPITQNFLIFMFVLIILSFVVNHCFYMWRRKK